MNDEGRFDNNVLFYGDSITWGMVHNDTARYSTPWPRLLESKLARYRLRVIESALCSRTTVYDDGKNAIWMDGARSHYFNGEHHFLPEFLSASPKWLVLMLGTNDLKSRIRLKVKERTRVDATKIASNCGKIATKAIEIHKKSPFCSGKLHILIVAPPRIVLNSHSVEMGYDEVSESISQEFHVAFETMAKENNFLYAAPDIDMSLSADGIHITELANTVVANAVWKTMLPQLKTCASSLKKTEIAPIVNNPSAARQTPKPESKKKDQVNPRVLAESKIVNFLNRVCQALHEEEFSLFIKHIVNMQNEPLLKIDEKMEQAKEMLRNHPSLASQLNSVYNSKSISHDSPDFGSDSGSIDEDSEYESGSIESEYSSD